METYNIEAIRGDTFNGVQFTTEVNGSPLNLSTAIIKIDFRVDNKKGAVVKSIDTVSGGITISNAAGGIFQIDAFVCDFPAKTYYYDIQFTLGDVIKTYIEGTFTVINDVTV